MASNDVTPSGVMSASAGDRRRGVEVLSARMKVDGAVIERELLARRWASMVGK